jgi:Ser/Thr protein kinase RdoA (MazF antagonist)
VKKLQQILGLWFDHSEGAGIVAAVPRGFSGANVWQVQCEGHVFALRQWPAHAGPVARLNDISLLQEALSFEGLPVPRPVKAIDGSFIADDGGTLWGLSTWLPGTADFWTAPRPAKLEVAMTTLARIHIAAARFSRPYCDDSPRLGLSRSLRQRAQKLHELNSGGMVLLVAAAHESGPHYGLVQDAVTLIKQTAPEQLMASQRWRDATLPLQWRLTDIWHDHVLFTADEVTGVIDFDAATLDTPSGDLARLLGSLVGDDHRSWELGLSAYERVRPLSAAEQEVIPFLDASGTVLSGANWVRWLFCSSETIPAPVDRQRAVERLIRLVERMRVLAER